MSINPDFKFFLGLPDDERRAVFEAAAERLNTLSSYIEKDFWVCHILDVLFNAETGDRPRLLFKGGTSLSKVHGIIRRFSEDIDIVVFRDDLGFVGENDPAHPKLGTNQRNRLVDKVNIQSELEEYDLSVPGIITIDAKRTFLDKVMILHGWYCGYRDERRLPEDRHRLSRHYYDVATITATNIADQAINDIDLLNDVIKHTKLFFHRGWMKLDEALTDSLKKEWICK